MDSLLSAPAFARHRDLLQSIGVYPPGRSRATGPWVVFEVSIEQNLSDKTIGIFVLSGVSLTGRRALPSGISSVELICWRHSVSPMRPGAFSVRAAGGLCVAASGI